MIGYHYTSFENYLKIQTEGLTPYCITDESIRMVFGTSMVEGIWLWKNRPVGISNAGTIIYQVSTKASQYVLILEVEYTASHIMKPNKKMVKAGQIVHIWHDGTIGNFKYHKDQDEEATILSKKVVPSKIKILELYDFANAFKKEL